MNPDKKIIHPAWLRMNHWINLIAVIIMVLSGWEIYNAAPIFDFSFPGQITLGGWLAGGLLWHFAAMWLLFFNGLVYLGMNIFSGRLKARFFPIRLRDLKDVFIDTLKGKLSHVALAEYNAVQKFAYLFVIVDLILLVMSGLVIWKPVQFPLLRELMGDYDNARIVHFFAMVALVPKTFLMMIRGR